MHFLLYIGFVLISTLAVLEAVCQPNTVCRIPRGVMVQSGNSVSLQEKINNKGRVWYIKPYNLPTNALMAFKNFSSPRYAAVVVITYHISKSKTTKYYYGDLKDFEIFFKDTIGIIIYVPVLGTKTANFSLQYYTGCHILTTKGSQVLYSNTIATGNAGMLQCWIIEPDKTEKRKQIYFSLRDIVLQEGEELTIWDVHSSLIIGKLKTSKKFTNFAAESNTKMIILIDIKINQHQKMPLMETKVQLTYHTFFNSDIDCIKRKQSCEYNSNEYDMFLCDEKCSAFTRMLIEEFKVHDTSHLLKSGDSNTKLSNIRNKCPWIASQCKCNRKNVVHTEFCDSDINCFNGGGCARVCFFAQLVTCPRLTIKQTISLL